MAGVTVVAWYPITPSSSLCESLIGYMRKYRMDKETGKATFAIVQAEDEIASLGMVIGARWAGARAMTATVGPGHLADVGVRRAWRTTPRLPAVIFDVQRVGPVDRACRRAPRRATSPLPRLCSHGDTKHILLLPASVEECYDDGACEAFDLAERFQTPVFVMIDLDLGMNNWMSEPFAYPEKPLDRGKVLDAGDAADDSASGAATRTSTATASRTARCRARHAGVLHARLGPQREGAVQRAAGRLRRTTSTGWRASSRRRATHVPAPVIELQRRREGRHHRLRHVALGDRREPRPAPRGTRASRRRTCGCGRIRSRTTSPSSSTRTSASTSSSRTATRRCWACCGWSCRPAQIGKLRSVLHYNGLPIDARTVTDDIRAQESRMALPPETTPGDAIVGAEEAV